MKTYYFKSAWELRSCVEQILILSLADPDDKKVGEKLLRVAEAIRKIPNAGEMIQQVYSCSDSLLGAGRLRLSIHAKKEAENLRGQKEADHRGKLEAMCKAWHQELDHALLVAAEKSKVQADVEEADRKAKAEKVARTRDRKDWKARKQKIKEIKAAQRKTFRWKDDGNLFSHDSCMTVGKPVYTEDDAYGYTREAGDWSHHMYSQWK